MFVLGIIVGILICITLLLLEMRATPSTVSRIEKILKKKQRGEVIHFPTDEEMAQQEIMRRNDEAGKPTDMKQL